ncbi:MAG TPA: biopolymer transporter ExbD [Deferrisomatales bacterium]|nr:biopolymer transporter ExbD [Deferrisomatales bacterium]
MKFKRRLIPDDEAVPMSSMADIAFLLIIFFMVTSVFDVDRGLLIELPETQVRESVDRKEMVLSIAADGSVSADGKPIGLAGIGSYVKAGRRVNPNRTVVVRSDRRVPYGAVTDVMDELLQAGVRDVALPTAAEGEVSE